MPINDLADAPTPAQTQTNVSKYHMSEEEQKRAVAGYYASVSYMDAQVGRVLDELDAQGLRENTIVVFASDHGYNLGEHNTWQKLSLFEDTLRIPLIVSGPGITSGSETSTVIEALDIYPTLAELAGVDAPQYLHGQSFAHILTGEDIQEALDGVAYSITFNGGESLRTSQWRYNLWANGDRELYHQQSDPGEFVNLADNRFFNPVMLQLDQLLQAKRIESFSFDPYLDLGDLDGDGVVTTTDWQLFRPHLLADLSHLTPQEAFELGDFDRNQRIDGLDFAIFKKAYEADNGFGSFSTLTARVPEPATLCWVILLIIGGVLKSKCWTSRPPISDQ